MQEISGATLVDELEALFTLLARTGSGLADETALTSTQRLVLIELVARAASPPGTVGADRRDRPHGEQGRRRPRRARLVERRADRTTGARFCTSRRRRAARASSGGEPRWPSALDEALERLTPDRPGTPPEGDPEAQCRAARSGERGLGALRGGAGLPVTASAAADPAVTLAVLVVGRPRLRRAELGGRPGAAGDPARACTRPRPASPGC